MMVNDPLEIYGLVLGVKIYDDLFNILVSFGVAYIPLMIYFFGGTSIFVESKGADAVDHSLKHTSMKLLGYILALMIFVAPTHPLDVTGVTYKPVCSTTAVTSKFGDTGTTYDHAFEDLNYEDLKLPIGLYLVLTGMAGITNAAMVSLPCQTDVQSITNTINTAHLTPELSSQVKRFQHECLATARSKFDSEHPDESTYKTTMDNYGGQSDLSWIGSHVFQEKYYSTLYPTDPVPGFDSTQYPSQYQNYNSDQGDPPSQWGYPSCQQWWSDPQNGLQAQLVKLVQDHDPSDPHLGQEPLSARVSSWLAQVKTYTHLGSQITPEDVITHSLLYDVGSEAGFGRNYSGDLDLSLHSFPGSNLGLETLATTGQGFSAVPNLVKRAEIENEIPIIKAVLLALGLALGPMILMIGQYRAHVIFTYYFMLGSILSITFIEQLIHYFDLSLHASMSYGIYSFGNSAIMYNVFTNLYFYAPMLYLMMLSICGVQVGMAIKGAFERSVSGEGSKFSKVLGMALLG